MKLNTECKNMLLVLEEIEEINNKKSKEQNQDYENTKLIVETSLSRFLHDDIKFIESLPEKKENETYARLILRNCIEQVIIFKFLCKKFKKNKNIFDDYMGYNIPDKLDESNVFKALKMLGGNRTTLYTNKFYELAKEFENINNDTSLYNYYGLMADYCHNSYFHRIKDTICNDQKFDIEEMNTTIFIILTQFCEEFDI